MRQYAAGGDKTQVLKAVRAAFEHEPRINLHRHPVHMDFQAGVLTLEGEVEHIAATKLCLRLAVAVPGVSGIVDRLHVAPAMRMGDGAILDAVRDALLQEPTLQHCSIKLRRKGQVETVREVTAQPRGVIEVSVRDGVVLLDDHVTSLAQKRFAGVLAWWVPGSRDVVNGLAVEPTQDDSDDEIAKTVFAILKKDPFVNVDRICVSANKAVVRLQGEVPSAEQKEMAEFDAWYVFGVDGVLNELTGR